MKNIKNLEFWDIVLVNFPFSDYLDFKKRPALILKSELDDYILLFISSKISNKLKNDYIIKKDNYNNLAVDSIIKIWKITSVNNQLIHNKIWSLTKIQKDDIKKIIISYFQDL